MQVKTALSELASRHPHYQIEIRPITFFRESEEIDQVAMQRLAELIRETGYWTVPIPVCLATGIVMDGNHRLSAARHLNLRSVPCIPLCYEDPRIAIECWNTGVPLRPAEIVQQILTDGTLPYKTTRHMFSPVLPNSNIPLAALAEYTDWSATVEHAHTRQPRIRRIL
jgi:hypothetical protein